jgi:hypothetical protein
MREMRYAYKILVRKSREERSHVEDLSADGRKILKI